MKPFLLFFLSLLPADPPQVPELKVYFKVFHRRSGDMTSEKIMLRTENDTIHFFKRWYSDRFRIYEVSFDTIHYKVQGISVAGYNGKRKLYTKKTRWQPRDFGVQFQDHTVNLKEDRLKVEITFEDKGTKAVRRKTVHLVLDQDWM